MLFGFSYHKTSVTATLAIVNNMAMTFGSCSLTDNPDSSVEFL